MSDPVAVRAIRTGLRVLGRVSPDAAAKVAVRLFFKPRRYERPERERKVLDTGRRLSLKCGLEATEWGGDGPVVLLMHGWEGRGTQLGAFAEPLARAGRRVVALDGPAHGDSAGGETNLLEFARALIAVERELGGIDAIVAHSFGSSATLLALDVGLRLRRMVVIAGPSSIADVLERFMEFLRMPPGVGAKFVEACARKVGRNVGEMDLTGIAARVNVPALIVHDRDDPEVPYADGVALANAWPAAELRTVTNLGHRRILRDPDVVREVVRFVTAGACVEAEVGALTRPAARSTLSH